MKLVLLTTGVAHLDEIHGLYLLTDEQLELITSLEQQRGGHGHEQLMLSRETQLDEIRALDVQKKEILRQIQGVIMSGIAIPYEEYDAGNRLL